MVSSTIVKCQQVEKGIKEIQIGLGELRVAIREGEEKESKVIVNRVIVAMLRLSGRSGVTETYTLCLFQLCGCTSTLYAAYRFRDAKADSHAVNCIFKHKTQLSIKMQRILLGFQLLSTHLYHSLPTALPSSYFHPHVSKDLAQHRLL